MIYILVYIYIYLKSCYNSTYHTYTYICIHMYMYVYIPYLPHEIMLPQYISYLYICMYIQVVNQNLNYQISSRSLHMNEPSPGFTMVRHHRSKWGICIGTTELFNYRYFAHLRMLNTSNVESILTVARVELSQHLFHSGSEVEGM